MNSVLECTEISKEYNGTFVIKDVSFSLYPGEIVSLVGPSGSGKSTLLQIAGLLDNNNGGQVMVNGVACEGMSDSKKTKVRRDNISFVYQFHHLLPEFSAIYNVALPLIIKGHSQSKAMQTAYETIAKLELLHLVNQMVPTLSGGERQRIAVARAFVTDNPIILADEPTGNLDTESSDHVWLMMQDIAKSGKSVLVVTHDSKRLAMVDRVLNMNDGVITDS